MSPLHPSESVAVRTPRADLDLAAFGGGNTDDASRLFLDHASPIAFQRRIFEEARDTRNPLLERVRFLAILGVNLSRLDSRGGLAHAARRLWREADTYLTRSLRPELVTHGIHLPAEIAFTTSGLDHLWMVSQLDRPDLHHPPLQPRSLPAGAAESLFDAIRARDILLHHPYDSFHPVIDLIRQAAADRDVTRIALTLYRTDRHSPIGDALLDAVRCGKHVQVIVELRAKHDELNNARWAAALRHAGAHVTYGVVGLKVHAKMALIVRRERGGSRRYAHVSSGNYHAATALAYTDLSLCTADEDMTADVSEAFEFMAGRASPPTFRKLLVAPFTLRGSVHELVEREIESSRRGEPGHIILKMNTLSDRDLIRQLYRASQAGVRVDLIVRGVCRLRPGVPGLSDRIHVRSIVGRFLEHSRAWYFRNGGNEDVYIGSADLRSRNFDRRLELMAPVTDAALARRVRQGILATYLADTVHARALRGDGSYVPICTHPGGHSLSSQRAFLKDGVTEAQP